MIVFLLKIKIKIKIRREMVISAIEKYQLVELLSFIIFFIADYVMIKYFK